MKRSLWIGALCTAWILMGSKLASAGDDQAKPPDFVWKGAHILVSPDGTLLGNVPPGRALSIAKTPNEAAVPVRAQTVRYSWDEIEIAPLEKLPRLTAEHLSVLLGQPCTLEQNATCVLIHFSDPSRILSPIRTTLDAEDSTLDNEINVTRESAAYVRYRRSTQAGERPRNLLLVRLDLVEFYADLLTDHPSGYAQNMVGYLATQAGILAVFDTRLTGEPKTELDLFGGGLDNGWLTNIVRVQAEVLTSPDGALVVLRPSEESEFENMRHEEEGTLWMSMAEFREALATIDWPGLRPLPVKKSEWQNIKTWNLLFGRLKPGTVRAEILVSAHGYNTVVSTADMVGVDAKVTLLLPERYLTRSGVQIFTLIIHHPWGRDVVRPIAIRFADSHTAIEKKPLER